MYPQLYYTVSSKDLRAGIPATAVLLSAASFYRMNNRGQGSLRVPRYALKIPYKGADCGAFTATLKWGDTYRFSPVQYVRWLYQWHPHWAATFDRCCLSASRGDPGDTIVAERQAWTSHMAWHFWELYRDVPWCWCPSVQGYSLDQFEQHARDLLPLIRQMHDYYRNDGWWDDEQLDTQYGNTFRVGIGSLCGRPLTFILEVVARVQAIIGIDIPLHLWAIKLKELQRGAFLDGVVSCDTGAWNGLFGREHEKRRASGLTETEYSWQVAYPAYARKIVQAQCMPRQSTLFREIMHHEPQRFPFYSPNWFIEEGCDKAESFSSPVLPVEMRE